VWRTGPARRLVRSGRFYATAAVAFGRVFLGATDGRQYSLSAADGSLSWARQTGGYVYSSAAVDDVRGGGPTVFFGSYDGWFYALDARSGRTRWRHRSGGRISGAATVIGRTVFFADLGKRVTIGLDTRTGDVAFRRHPGAFDPIISDGRFLFQTGRSSLTALLPVTSERAKRLERRERARARRRARAERRERARAERRERAQRGARAERRERAQRGARAERRERAQRRARAERRARAQRREQRERAQRRERRARS
jgi:hypothetical protein